MGFPIQKNDDVSILRRIITRNDIMDNFEEYQKAIAFYRWYPDLFVDLLVEASGPECTFKLYAYQRLMLRAMARYSEVNLTFSRGTSKSFTNVLFQVIKCILWPGTKGTVCAATKDQSSEILGAKLGEVLEMIPVLNFEIKKQTAKDGQIKVLFKNGSWLRNIATKGSTRGQRSTIVTTEEIIICNADNLQAVVRPLLAIPRRAANGEVDTNEATRRQEVILTTAGYKGSYAYQRLMANLIRMVTEPGKAIVLGGSYRVPIIGGLQDMEYIRTQMTDSNYNPSHFQREYMSNWSSGSETAFFPGDTFDKLRVLQEPEFEQQKNLPNGVEYIFGLDVGRLGDNSELTIIKRTPQKGSPSMKSIVNIFTYEKMSFPEQAFHIKKMYYKYKPVKCVIDGAGLGVGLIDELIISQIDPETGGQLAPWQIANDEKGEYTKYKSPDGIKDFLWIYKANPTFNTLMYGNLQTQLLTGKLRFLQEERLAKSHIETSRAQRFKEMTEEDRALYLLPFFQTSFLKAQMMNLESKNDGANIIMKQANAMVNKDKVSSLGYGLLYIKQEMDDKELYRQATTIDAMLRLGAAQTKKSTRLTFNNNRDYSRRKK